MRSTGAVVCGLLAMAALAACKGSQSARCSLGEALLITQDEVASYDGVALVTTATGAHAIWSDRLGLFVKSLAEKQRPALRLAGPCPGGVSALAFRGAIYVACLRPPSAEEGAGALELLRVEATSNRAQLIARSSALGRDARGVALASSGSTLYLAYADGDVGRPRVQLVAVDASAHDVLPAPVPLSAADQNGREPALLVTDEGPIVVFCATELGPGPAHHRLMIARVGKPARLLLELKSESPLPALARDGEGIVLAFRDLPRPKARMELFVARLDPSTLALRGKARSIGRANGRGGPSLALCKNTRAVAIPIDHAGELYVAFNPLSPQLTTPEANHQYYESEHEFVESSAACRDGYPLALIAERTEANRPEARLLAAEFRCQP